MSPPNGTLLVVRDIAAEWDRAQADALADHLQQRLHQPVSLWIEQDSPPPITDAIQSLIDRQVRSVTVLTMGLFGVPERGLIYRSLAWAKQQIPELQFQLASSLTWIELSSWLTATAIDALSTTDRMTTKTGILIVGRSYPNPMTNANLACLAHLIRETDSVTTVGHAFLDALQPTVPAAIRSMIASGITNLIVISWLMFDDESLKYLNDELRVANANEQIKAKLVSLNLCHPSLVNLLVANHLAARTIDPQPATITTEPSKQLTEGNSSNTSRPKETSETEVELKQLESRINSMLPPEYRGQYEQVSSKSMGTAGLKYDQEGLVAWDEIWTSFCDLALAGGPPHRGTLLEAVTAEEANAERQKYDAVVNEIGRGIRMVTGLPIVNSKSAGWVGVRCHNEEMAIWLMRAIIVENVMVRRESDVIYLPAGPKFTIKREIKNVITSVAKTVHYWTAHLNARKSTPSESTMNPTPNFATDSNRDQSPT